MRDLQLPVRLSAHLPLQDIDEALRHQPAAYQPVAENISGLDRYSDGDREDLEWEEIFSGAADIRALKLPRTIENDLDNFVDTAVAQPDTAFKACEHLTAPTQPAIACMSSCIATLDLSWCNMLEIEGRVRQAIEPCTLHVGRLTIKMCNIFAHRPWWPDEPEQPCTGQSAADTERSLRRAA